MKKNKLYIIAIGVLGLIVIGYFIIDSILYNPKEAQTHYEVKAKPITEQGFQANFFAKENTKNKPTVILIGGGQWGDYWGQELAKKGFVGLSLPYTNRENLPKLPEEISLEYFEKAIQWLRKQEAVNPKKIVLMGASRNAELSLVVASVFPKLIGGVIAYAPSAVSWSNTVLPYSSDEVKASWKNRGKDIPYVAMPKISGGDSDTLHTLAYWEKGLTKADSTPEAIIKVEKIQGPILLFSGADDKVWPSVKMANMIKNRLKKYHFKYGFQSIKYENAGHLISTHPDINSDVRTSQMNVQGKEYIYEFGGTKEGDKKAKQAAKVELFEFLESL